MLGYLRELRQMITWCRRAGVRISAECWETCSLEFCIFKSLPDDEDKISWSPTTFKENSRKLRAAVALLGLGVASKSADFESISKAIQGRNPSRVPEGNAAADRRAVLPRVHLEWQFGSIMTARLMLVGLLTMARPLDLQTLEWCSWKKVWREDGQPLLSMHISAKGIRLHTRELLWPQGPPGSAWRQLWEEVWRTTTQAEVGGAPESRASAAQWAAFNGSLRTMGISPNGLRPTGYNFWLVRGVPQQVVKEMGAWAANSTIPSRHYLRVHLIDQVFKAAAMSVEELE